MKKSNKKIWIIIGSLLLIVILLLIFSPREEKSYDIKDRCGPMVNFISHSVEHDSACKIQCSSKCDTVDMKYSKHEFTGRQVGCNSCTCYCKEPLFGK